MPRLRSTTARAQSAKTPPALKRSRKRREDKFDQRFSDAMKALEIGVASPIALALSGGGDSTALMRFLGHWAQVAARSNTNSSLHALIVDHGLRGSSAGEAKKVAARARAAGWRPHILKWTGEKPESNIEDAARKARYALMGKWCQKNNAKFLSVAHTRDDVAETFLLRLGRGSGVDGLSAMRALAPYPMDGFTELGIARPLLDFGREELRSYLEKEGIVWLEDPMNENPRFSRVRVRALMPALEAAGISQQRIVDAARHLARAREALDADANQLLREYTHMDAQGTIFVDRRALIAVPREIGLRALSKLIVEVSGAVYRPRFERLSALYSALYETERFRARTLHGCRMGPAPRRLQLFGSATIEIKQEKARKRPSQ